MRNNHRAFVLIALPLAACSVLATPVAPDVARPPARGGYQLQAVTSPVVVAATADSQLATAPTSALDDGNLATPWSNGGYQAPTAWARLQFAADTPLASLGVRMPPATAGTSYDLQVSADGVAWTTVLTGLTNTTWNVESKVFPAGTHGTYLRLFWHNSTSAPQPHVNIYELVPVGGTSTSAPPSTPPSASPTPTPLPSTSPSASPTPTPLPSASPTPTPRPSTSPSASPTPTPRPSTSPTPTPSTAPVYPQASDPGPNAVAGLLYNRGLPAAGITIAAMQSGGSVSKSVTTDATGKYVVTGLPAGNFYAYYYNDSDSNKIGYWRSLTVAVSGTHGAVFPTLDLYLKGQTNIPLPGSHTTLPTTFSWLGPVQPVNTFQLGIHSVGGTSFQTLYQSGNIPGTATTFTWNGTTGLLSPIDPNHRYFWGVQWNWGPLGQGGNLFQGSYFTP